MWGPGAGDVRLAADALAARLPSALAPLARNAYDYRWSWRGGDAVFEAVDPHRWALCGHNPVRLLQEAPTLALERAAADNALRHRAATLEATLANEIPGRGGDGLSPERPIAFMCAEFGVHPSLPIYSGGLGILAGDILKEASDQDLPMVGVGLLYRQGFFRQRLDLSGWQHEYWVDVDPERLPTTLVTRDDGRPLTISVQVRGRDVVAQIWRVDVGRVPLFLLDADVPENQRIDRWITARLYDSDRSNRLCQYALLGFGGIAALEAMGIDPAVVHLNEGHPALAALALAARAEGTFTEAMEQARQRTVFTTHTPVPAGNETYAPDKVNRALDGLDQRLGTDWETLLRLGRINPDDPDERSGMTVLGLRLSRNANGVSRRHGEVSRAMWQPVWGNRPLDDVPIGHVTNGVHLPTWMAGPLKRLLDSHFGPGWTERTDDPALWDGLDAIPDAELWAVRTELRRRLVEYARDRATRDRLARGEPASYVEAAASAFDPALPIVGFARRVATYKRLHLIAYDLDRALRLLDGERPIQVLLAGKAHPADDGAKSVVQSLLAIRRLGNIAERVAFLEDYDTGMAAHLVAGCDVWVNLPRPPLEASGTSGMKSAMNGGLNLSVLDGWWAEAYDGTNGWAIDGSVVDDAEAQDARDAAAMYDLLEHDIVPLFHERDAGGVPVRWIAMVKAAIRTAGLRFSARRMVDDYRRQAWRP
jgi:starch phosphorylase